MRITLFVALLHCCIVSFAQKTFSEQVHDYFHRRSIKKGMVMHLEPAANKDSGSHYLGDLKIENEKKLNRRAARKLVEFFADSTKFLPPSSIKSCAFIPGYTVKFSSNGDRLIAYAVNCKQVSMISSDLKKVMATAGLTAAGEAKLRRMLGL